MTELKTLKDLTGMVGMLPLKSDILDINVVKWEAIKWVKDRIINCDKCSEFEHKGNWLICEEHSFWFERFNITEEDLR